MQPLLAQRHAQQQHRQRVVELGCLLSPALTLQLLTDVLAGTDAERFAQFEQEIDAAQQRWRAFFGPKIMSLSKLTAEDYNAVPRVDALLLRSLISQQLTALLLLLLTITLLASGYAWKLLRR